jgi:hypothetical protein
VCSRQVARSTQCGCSCQQQCSEKRFPVELADEALSIHGCKPLHDGPTQHRRSEAYTARTLAIFGRPTINPFACLRPATGERNKNSLRRCHRRDATTPWPWGPQFVRPRRVAVDVWASFYAKARSALHSLSEGEYNAICSRFGHPREATISRDGSARLVCAALK